MEQTDIDIVEECVLKKYDVDNNLIEVIIMKDLDETRTIFKTTIRLVNKEQIENAGY